MSGQPVNTDGATAPGASAAPANATLPETTAPAQEIAAAAIAGGPIGSAAAGPVVVPGPIAPVGEQPETTAGGQVAAAEPQAAAASPSPEAPAPGGPSAAFTELAGKMATIVSEVGTAEVWGVELQLDRAWDHIPTSIVVQKFLNASSGDVASASAQFSRSLQWRKNAQPLALVQKAHSAKFADLGCVTVYGGAVFTWNLYGNVKDRMDEVFVPLDE